MVMGRLIVGPPMTLFLADLRFFRSISFPIQSGIARIPSFSFTPIYDPS